jgi:cytochrome c556
MKSLVLAAGLACALVACRSSSSGPTKQEAVASEAAATTAAEPMHAMHGMGGGGAAADPDTRTPLPMNPMMATHQKMEMRDHLRVVQEVAGALATDDFDAVVKAAARISWSETQAAECERMGAGVAGFAEAGEQFHKTADGIVEAARRKDRAGVASALEATLRTCVGCHDTYRQDVVADGE